MRKHGEREGKGMDGSKGDDQTVGASRPWRPLL